MLLKYLGHSFFVITTERGTVLATDPYGDFYQYPRRRVRADICTMSHHHGDHAGANCLEGAPIVLDQPGIYRPAEDVQVVGIPTKHDHHGGVRRGDNVFFIMEAEGLRIGHAGDLGHPLNDEQARQIGRLDVLLLPVGGTYTVDAREACQIMERLKPKTTIPMHYQTGFNPAMNIRPVDDFLALAGVSPKTAPLLRLTAADMSQRDSVMIMEVME